MPREADEYRDQLLEAVAETDEALLEKYLGGEELTVERDQGRDPQADDRQRDLPGAVRHARSRTRACSRMLDAVVDYLPLAARTCRRPWATPRQGGRGGRPRKPTADEPFSALAFKIADAPVLRQADLHPRVLGRASSPAPQVINADQGQEGAASGKLFQMHANKENPVDDGLRRAHLRGDRPEGHHHR